MHLFLRQVWVLTVKNLLLVCVRPYRSTGWRALVLPVVFIAFISFAKNLFVEPSIYGIGDPTPVRTFSDALDTIGGGRNKLVFVNSGFETGNILQVIDAVSDPAKAQGKDFYVLTDEEKLDLDCRSSLRGVSSCIAAVIFHSSPTEGPGGIWNYTLRTDGSLGEKIDVKKTRNDQELYLLPFQHSIDWAIARVENVTGLPSEVDEYPYTSLTQKQREEKIRSAYMSAIIDILGDAIFIGSVGVTYHLTGLMASERELGMSQLIDCMMPNTARWQPQAARFTAAHLALDMVYGPAWIITALILKFGVYSKTSAGVTVIFNLLMGLSLSSFSIFGAFFFKKAQLSGISMTITCLVLGIIAQLASITANAAVVILSLIFPPMNYVFFSILMARWEKQNLPTDLTQAAPGSPWTVPGIVLWILLIIQIVLYPCIGGLVERRLYSTASKDRNTSRSGSPSALRLQGLEIVNGQIMVLLGANGSGKSTTLDAISGLTKITSGEINLNHEEDGIRSGLCPQKNVLWDTLTVMEHKQLSELLHACDLSKKVKAFSKTLSGGQKRKLQLAMMFTGGSSICCVDETEDLGYPLAERGSRTILLTTHFLDEAELLADHIAILSKGALKAEGSSVELKHRLGSGYRIHVYNLPSSSRISNLKIAGASKQVHFDETVYTVPTSADAANLVTMLEEEKITEYRVSGPTIGDVFLKVAQDIDLPLASSEDDSSVINEKPKDDGTQEIPNQSSTAPRLLSGKQIGMLRQAWVLFCKRVTILRRNNFLYVAALLIPVIAAALVTLFLKSASRAGCSSTSAYSTPSLEALDTLANIDIVLGPTDKVTTSALDLYCQCWKNRLHLVDSLQEFNTYIDDHFANVTPGGFYIGDSSSLPSLAWNGDEDDFALASIIQNALDIFVTNTSIGFQFHYFAIPWASGLGKSLQLIVYFCLAMAVYPAFFSLYPTFERLRRIRGLHYSNGVRSLPLWLVYLAFDFCIVVAISVLAIVAFRAASDIWYHSEYLFVVFFLYGLCSTLFSYVISLFVSSQLAAFAFAAGAQCVGFLIYLIAYLCILTYAPTAKIDSYITIAHFVISVVTPMGSLTRAMFSSLNIFSILCRDKEVASYPGEITLYGGPIVYLVVQSLILFAALLLLDEGPALSRLLVCTKGRGPDLEDSGRLEPIVGGNAPADNDGLGARHLTKSFKKITAVEDVTFGVNKGEVFALLGPNGAGKTTTISLIRGDIKPSRRGGEILVENVSVIKNRAAARAHLGVCPQFDAMDQTTVLEHLRFYARIRGVSDVEHNIREVLRAVGLTPFQHRMAMKLSGGNRRKLSLGIALMGNPAMLLLDEPSSGMDAASKRVMWKTLVSVVPGRSIVLTTHSMEEADALANRAGIMAKRMLALGTTDDLRARYGNMYHVHLVHSQAPHTSDSDMERIRRWVIETFPGAEIEQKTYHGQLRFSVPASLAVDPPFNTPTTNNNQDCSISQRQQGDGLVVHLPDATSKNSGIGTLFASLENDKQQLGFQHYSVSQTSLDQVFLTIVGQHNVQEENSG
ncbi:hypothetical protein ASPZODRAFT_150657 [Penicilliopsis zonata CBS 506.65]|uniref:ABC transporter domain-containing protein n=1 Tax=Penicilliopsis zonata CBS 506.65 TaxID=1073090 RepID=A0A1L9SME0_9EURO|nr:hypothetical protein ASPZODRAFT_150657 [Penicilliopsis zonata CBS 506.65]OJJ48429.1 hypothetical protein ASPZODRAFT_150657 [Penicilliopsis zonata CBS 506.65]